MSFSVEPSGEDRGSRRIYVNEDILSLKMDIHPDGTCDIFQLIIKDSKYDRSGNCKHLGSETTDRLLCEQCNGEVYIKLFACGIHGQCTLKTKFDEHPGCDLCPDYSRP